MLYCLNIWSPNILSRLINTSSFTCGTTGSARAWVSPRQAPFPCDPVKKAQPDLANDWHNMELSFEDERVKQVSRSWSPSSRVVWTGLTVGEYYSEGENASHAYRHDIPCITLTYGRYVLWRRFTGHTTQVSLNTGAWGACLAWCFKFSLWHFHEQSNKLSIHKRFINARCRKLNTWWLAIVWANAVTRHDRHYENCSVQQLLNFSVVAPYAD